MGKHFSGKGGTLCCSEHPASSCNAHQTSRGGLNNLPLLPARGGSAYLCHPVPSSTPWGQTHYSLPRFKVWYVKLKYPHFWRVILWLLLQFNIFAAEHLACSWKCLIWHQSNGNVLSRCPHSVVLIKTEPKHWSCKDCY